jgi:hypothetical protein
MKLHETARGIIIGSARARPSTNGYCIYLRPGSVASVPASARASFCATRPSTCARNSIPRPPRAYPGGHVLDSESLVLIQFGRSCSFTARNSGCLILPNRRRCGQHSSPACTGTLSFGLTGSDGMSRFVTFVVFCSWPVCPGPMIRQTSMAALNRRKRSKQS